jgi:hypothetical protein
VLARALPEGACAVGYLRYIAEDAPSHAKPEPPALLLAHVLGRDGRVMRIELGSMDAVERAVDAWRTSIRAPSGSGEAAEIAAGEGVRKLVLDPVLAAARGARTLYVCLDDALHLVPLDALPAPSEAQARASKPPAVPTAGFARVGDSLRVRIVPSLGWLVEDRRPPSAAPSLVALGGIEFDATVGLDAGFGEVVSAPPVGVVAMARGAEEHALGRDAAWKPLPDTLEEVRGVAAFFEHTFDARATVLDGAAATKQALYERAPGTRYLHVATHGWFAPQSVRSIADDPAGAAPWTRLGAGRTLVGFAPMTLCGFALAGANRGPDPLGRVPGVITAEELCGLDLSQCEIAVLSACETSIGIPRAGQGIASVQAALHAAGARTVITSLWKVSDDRTRELMLAFYRNLWVEKLPKDEALWRAKRELRLRRAPSRDWAGWVLSGETR